MSNLEALLLDQIKAAGLKARGTWINGRHSRGSGFEKDAEKYAEALCLGWKVLRVTGSQICTGKAIKWICELQQEKDKTC